MSEEMITISRETYLNLVSTDAERTQLIDEVIDLKEKIRDLEFALRSLRTKASYKDITEAQFCS